MRSKSRSSSRAGVSACPLHSKRPGTGSCGLPRGSPCSSDTDFHIYLFIYLETGSHCVALTKFTESHACLGIPSAGIKGVSLQAGPHLQVFCVKIATHTLKARKNAYNLGSGLISIPRHCQRTSNKTVDCNRSCLPLSVWAELLTFNLVRP